MLLGRGGHSDLGRTVDYEKNLWRPAIRFGFSTGVSDAKGRVRQPERESVHRRAMNLKKLRNRVAHHEPIFPGIAESGTGNYVALEEVWDQSVELLGWMSPELAQIHRTDQRLSSQFARRPSLLRSDGSGV